MSGSTNDDVLARARAWAAIDPEYGAEINDLIDRDPDAAAGLFDGRIAFGTAGLRAVMGPGPKRMNRLVVHQATVGLMDWLPAGSTVVVGFDARHNSERYARDAVAAIVAGGGRPLVVARPAPTPVVARAVLDHDADAGIVITASHNPPDDNGYKLYLGDGIQLVDPADAEIAAAIDRVAARNVPLPADGVGGGDWSGAEDVTDAALAAHRDAAVGALSTEHREVNVLYTAMHGVGGRHLLDCFDAAGFPAPAVVAEQFEPDPTFPTAPFPNPEEPGALDLALAGAAAASARVDVILANDPDADRLAIAVADADGSWARLSGDEVGALLADHVVRNRAGAGSGANDRPWLVASSIVSSRFIDALAEAEGGESVRTLTGFKWVARPIVDRPDADYLFGFEEALGYCIGTGVRDKDGISAALAMAELAASCKASGRSLRDRLDELVEAYGLHATAQVTVAFGDRPEAEQDRIRRAAVAVEPTTLAGAAVVAREDLSQGRHLPPTAGVVFDLDGGDRVIIRPSGTEPKVKAYLEVVRADVPPGNAKEARRDAELRLDRLAEAVAGLLNDPA